MLLSGFLFKAGDAVCYFSVRKASWEMGEDAAGKGEVRGATGVRVDGIAGVGEGPVSWHGRDPSMLAGGYRHLSWDTREENADRRGGDKWRWGGICLMNKGNATGREGERSRRRRQGSSPPSLTSFEP